jgi:hypothetical protein
MAAQPPPPPKSTPPGLLAQIGMTRDAAWQLAMAHVELAKAEAAAIGGKLALLIGLIILALALLFMAIILVVVGVSLFLGAWLLGSMGWGVLHGMLLFTGLAVVCVFAAVGLPGRAIGLATLGGLLIGIVVAVLLGFELPNRAYAAIGDSLASTFAIEAGVRPLVVGVVLGALVGLVLGIGLGLRIGGWVMPVALVILGATLGALSAVTYGLQVGVALGITVGYIAWIALLVAAMAAAGIDAESLKQRFYPSQTIDTSKETLEWLKTRLPRGTGS